MRKTYKHFLFYFYWLTKVDRSGHFYDICMRFPNKVLYLKNKICYIQCPRLCLYVWLLSKPTVKGKQNNKFKMYSINKTCNQIKHDIYCIGFNDMQLAVMPSFIFYFVNFSLKNILKGTVIVFNVVLNWLILNSCKL